MIKKIIVFILVILFLILMTLYTPRYHLKGIFAAEKEWEAPKHIGQSWDPAEYEGIEYPLESHLTAKKIEEKPKKTVAPKINEAPAEEGEYYEVRLKVTAYCSACNSPKGSTQTASGAAAYIGSVAMKNVPFGTKIHIEGYGAFTVQDRPGNNVVDVYVGTMDECKCDKAGYSGVRKVKVYK